MERPRGTHRNFLTEIGMEFRTAEGSVRTFEELNNPISKIVMSYQAKELTEQPQKKEVEFTRANVRALLANDEIIEKFSKAAKAREVKVIIEPETERYKKTNIEDLPDFEKIPVRVTLRVPLSLIDRASIIGCYGGRMDVRSFLGNPKKGGFEEIFGSIPYQIGFELMQRVPTATLDENTLTSSKWRGDFLRLSIELHNLLLEHSETWQEEASRLQEEGAKLKEEAQGLWDENKKQEAVEPEEHAATAEERARVLVREAQDARKKAAEVEAHLDGIVGSDETMERLYEIRSVLRGDRDFKSQVERWLDIKKGKSEQSP